MRFPPPSRMNAWNELYARALWPASDRGYCGLRRELRRFAGLEYASSAALEQEQWRALRRLLVHAQRTCPFYRNRFAAAGLEAERMRQPEELRRLPVLTRAELREHGNVLCSSAFGEAQRLPSATGGTTDTPVPLWRDLEALRQKHAVQGAFNLWAGWRPGDKVFHLWQAQSDFAQRPSWRWKLYDRYFHRQVWAPISHFNPEIMESYRQSYNHFRPRILHSYPTPLAIWAEYLDKHPARLHRPQAAICTAESLLPEQRALIERVFQCPVFEHYGSREFAMIGAECEARQGMHLNPLAAYVEYQRLGDDPDGPQEMLVTDLLNYAMPLIRYRINDSSRAAAAPAACPCGRGYPLLRPIQGRVTDIFRLPNGDLLPGVALPNKLLRVVPGLAQTQIIQETLYEYRLRYVPGAGFGPADLERLRAGLGHFFPSGLHWTFEAVREIPREPSGKTRFCISRLPPASSTAGREAAQ